MKGEKQSRQDLLEKKVQALINVVQQLLNENSYLKDLSVGTLEAVKLMPGYEEAIKALTEKIKEEKKKLNAPKDIIAYQEPSKAEAYYAAPSLRPSPSASYAPPPPPVSTAAGKNVEAPRIQDERRRNGKERKENEKNGNSYRGWH